MNSWSSFLTAEVGASAALSGLIFVGVSINLQKILGVPILSVRAFEALFLLLSSLVISSVLLVPGQSQTVIGIEVLALSIGIWLVVTMTNLRIYRNVTNEFKRASLAMIVISQLAAIAYIGSGITLLSAGFIGMYVVVPAILLSIIKANIDAWVLLVEINR